MLWMHDDVSVYGALEKNEKEEKTRAIIFECGVDRSDSFSRYRRSNLSFPQLLMDFSLVFAGYQPTWLVWLQGVSAKLIFET